MKNIRSTTALFAIGFSLLLFTVVQGQGKSPTPDPYFLSPAKTSDFAGGGSISTNTGSQNRNAAGSASRTASHSSIVQSPQSGQHRLVGHEESASQPFKVGKVLALVGGEPIFVGDMMFDINQAIEAKIPTAPDSIKQKQRELAVKQLLPQFVQSKMLYISALNEVPEGVDMEAVFAQIESQFDDQALPKMMENAGIKSTVEFDARLRGQDYSLRQLRRSWAIKQFTRHSVGNILADVPEVTHQEMLDRYQKNITQYDRPARAKWEQIMVRYDQHPSRTAARKKMVELGNKIVHGAQLAEVAKSHSDGFRADEGGRYDWTTKGALALKELDQTIFEIPIGLLSDVIETDKGLHIVRVIEREPASRVPFLDAQVEIKKKLEGEKREAAFKKYNEQLRDEIPVEYLVNE